MIAEQDIQNSPASRVIAVFGGLTRTAEALGKSISTVQGWKERGRIPPEHWREIMDAAKKLKKTRLKFEDFVPERVG